MRKFTHIKQNGEMGYNQPGFTIPATQTEIANSVYGRLTIDTLDYEQVTTCLTTGEVRTHQYTELSQVCCRDGELFVSQQSFREVADAANYFGDRLPPEFYSHYKGILIEEKEHA